VAEAILAGARATCPAAFNPCFIDDMDRVPEARSFDYACMYLGAGCAGLGVGVVVALVGYGLYRVGYFLTR
jgi:hypothetical protein